MFNGNVHEPLATTLGKRPVAATFRQTTMQNNPESIFPNFHLSNMTYKTPIKLKFLQRPCVFHPQFLLNSGLPRKEGKSVLNFGSLIGFRSNFRRTSETPTATTSQKVSQYTSHLYCNTPPICIAVLLVPLGSKERETMSVLLPFVPQYASHLYRSTLGKSWWLWSLGCSP